MYTFERREKDKLLVLGILLFATVHKVKCLKQAACPFLFFQPFTTPSQVLTTLRKDSF